MEDRLLFDRILPGLLIPDRIGVGLEVHGAAGIVACLENGDDRICRPPEGIGRFRPQCLPSRFQGIRRNGQHLLFGQLLCNLHRPPAFHTKIKDVSDHLGGLFIYDPLFGILRIFEIPEGRVGRQMLSTFTLGLVHRTDLPAGVSGIEFVEPHPDPREVIVHTVLIGRIEIVVDGNVADIVFCKSDVDEHPRHRGITPQTGKVLCQQHRHMVRFDFVQHGLEAGTVKIGSAVSVIYEEDRIWEMMFFTIRL